MAMWHEKGYTLAGVGVVALLLLLMVMAIPASVERVEVYRPLAGTDAYVCCRLVSMSEESTVVDLTIRERDSTPCYAMKSLVLRTIARVVK